ncbi:glycosyltransferase family 4 protein [Salicibibacter kimchii]|uniref:Glycosyltransferase family 1 protein n=1 Tax=Salicibibacter kimchii TaxID=2099786 RepID=A0A345BWH7_9BACI|nr:glycosyltransferase family 4 protein [Salicibibacter kimchii]AXF55308.1 glycosyltransferase family 1 protein [Salicibibacter kimchii]
MKRVAHICTVASSHNILMDKLQELQKHEYKVHIYSDENGLNPSFSDSYDIPYFFSPMSRSIEPLKDIRSIFTLAKKLKAGQYDIVHTHTSKAGIIGRLAAKKAKVPLIVHTSHGLPFYEGQSRKKHNLYRSLEKIGTRFCHAITSQNYEDIDAIQALNKRLFVYYEGNGVVLDQLDQSTDKVIVTDLKQEYEIPENKIVLLMAARLEPVKNHEFLLRALYIVKKNCNDDFICLIAGDGPEKDRLKSLLPTMNLENNVNFIGRKSNIYDFIKMADISVLTSKKEGVPRFIMESMAFAKPVVASDALGTRELVSNDESGFLVPLEEDERLADAIQQLITDEKLRTEFGERGRQIIKEQFTEQQVAKRIDGIYRELWKEVD